MTPQFEPVKEGYRIYLASSPQDDPKLKFRREVQEILHKNNGEISSVNHKYLEYLSNSLGLYRQFEEIITEEKQPYVLFKDKLKDYESAFNLAVEESYPLTANNRETLQKFQLLLGLRDEDVADIEKRFSTDLSGLGLEIFTTTKIIKNSTQNDEIKLLSDKNVDYTKLRNFLANGEWKEADMETARCMLKVAEQEEQRYLKIEDIENFPCTDLRTIDQLWVKYSDGKLGFSVQKKIYQSLGGTKEYNREVWEKFGEQVGWKKGDKWL
ncbi:MAG: GUN4 domain-containing protein, partial [Okeania sp. SIO2C2]|nr:GUN4 domain-containing protein [Okeania sp. SIO2C2]